MRRWIGMALLMASAGCAGGGDQGSDVVVGYHSNGTTVTLAAGQQLAVELQSAGSGGFDPWAIDTAPDAVVLKLVRSEHVTAAQEPGSTSTDRFVFGAAGAGTTELAATSSSPQSGTTLTFQLRVVVR